MPQFIAAPIALAAFHAGAGIAVSNAILGIGTAGAILHTTVSTAIVLGASYAVAKLNAPPTPRPSNGSVERRDGLSPRFFSYGLCKVSGPVLFLETNNRELLKITAFGTRKMASMPLFYIDGNAGPLSPGIADSDGSYQNWTGGGDLHGFVRTHLGHEDQAADALLLSLFPWWTDAHQLKGIPYAFAELQSGDPVDFQGAFPNGEPSFAALGGVEVYDPRKDSTNGGSGSHRRDDPSTWEFSENQRLACLDWLTWRDGYNKSWDRIDWATWVPQIEMADEAVPLKAGGTEPRYRIATIVSLDEPKGRVLRRIEDAGDQQTFYTGDGLIGSRGGVWQEPTVMLDVAGQPESAFTHGVPEMERVNEFDLSAMLPSHDYSEVNLKPWSRTSDPDYAAGIIRRAPLELLQVPSNSQAQRLAKIRMEKMHPRWAGSLRTSFAALAALGEAAINLTFDELDQPAGSFNGPFLVAGKVSVLPDRTGMTVPVSSIDPACYDWNAATEEQDAPPTISDPAMGMLLIAAGTPLAVGAGTLLRVN